MVGDCGQCSAASFSLRAEGVVTISRGQMKFRGQTTDGKKIYLLTAYLGEYAGKRRYRSKTVKVLSPNEAAIHLEQWVRENQRNQVKSAVRDFVQYSTEWVYFVRSPNGLWKIGRTISLEQRLTALQSSSPVKLMLISAISSSLASFLESALHQHLADIRQHGEWFALDKGLETRSVQKLLGITPSWLWAFCEPRAFDKVCRDITRHQCD